ncbi:MAG: hypothetical protein OSB47_11300, partial [Pirellulaceae bacterium]|nr:hypothetical protein [Pirellulaceae bacterium]
MRNEVTIPAASNSQITRMFLSPSVTGTNVTKSPAADSSILEPNADLIASLVEPIPYPDLVVIGPLEISTRTISPFTTMNDAEFSEDEWFYFFYVWLMFYAVF